MAMQTNMLTAAGIDAPRAATALTGQSVLSTAALVAMPVFSIPFIIAGTQIPSRLLSAVWIGIPVFLLTMAIGVAVFVFDAPLFWLGRVIARDRSRSFGRGTVPDPELGDRLLQSRDAIRDEVGPRWGIAVGASVLRWFFEYGVIIATLYGLDVQPDPALTLLAFVARFGARVVAVHSRRSRLRRGGPHRDAGPRGRLRGRRARHDARLPAPHVLAPVAHRRRRGRDLPSPIPEGAGLTDPSGFGSVAGRGRDCP